ncbi:pirin family protein [Nocardioides rubriscoriae]|uniref:pirin family protein n=1 Tax=Nocardioides rubriscoriae TaxID=642762 RepID=UPI001478FF44|nr:pirin family protein [Nocardioides rubriscoriae]
MSTEIRRGTERFVEREPGRRTFHSLAFGASYDADNLRFGPMVCHDDHLVGVGRGFETHRHSDLVIVTYVVSGALAHTGPEGTTRVEAGSIAVLRTGAGVDHSEVAAAPQTRFVQVWLTPPEGEAGDEPAAPSYEVVEGDSVEVFPGARLQVLRVPGGATGVIPPGPLTHVYVARGALLRSSLAEPLQEGDAFRFTDEPALEVTAGVDSELLVWSFGTTR